MRSLRSHSTARGSLLRTVDAWLDQWLESGEHPATADPNAQAPLAPFLDVLRRLKQLLPHARTAAAMRSRFRADMDSMRVGFPVASAQELSIPGAQGMLAARWYRPNVAVLRAPLTLYFHGGGFIMGDLETHDDACRILCEASGVSVLSVAYRLAPEAPFPAAVEDTLAAAQWALTQLERFGATSLAVAGDSAGGNLAAVVAQHLAASGVTLAGQLLIYPGTDRSQQRASHGRYGRGYFLDNRERDLFTQSYLLKPAEQSLDVRVSPLLASIAPSLAPTLLVTAGYDVLRDEGHAYADKLAHAGIRMRLMYFPRLVHGFINLASVHRESRTALEAVARAWRDLLLTAPLSKAPHPTTVH